MGKGEMGNRRREYEEKKWESGNWIGEWKMGEGNQGKGKWKVGNRDEKKNKGIG